MPSFADLAAWAATDAAGRWFALGAVVLVLGAAVAATWGARSRRGAASDSVPTVVRFYAAAVVAFGLVVSLAFLVTIAPPIGRMLFGADRPADALGVFFAQWGPVSVLLAGLVGALSLPLIIYRADVATKQARASEQLAQDAIRKSDLQERDMAERAKAAARDVAQREAAAVKADISERTLRATELLGATVERERRETLRETVMVEGEPKETQREVFVTAREPNIEVRLGAIYALERVAKEDVEAAHWPIIQTMLAYIRERRGAPDAVWARFAANHGAAPDDAVPDGAAPDEGLASTADDVDAGGVTIERLIGVADGDAPARRIADETPSPARRWADARLLFIEQDDFAAAARANMPEDVVAAIGVLRRRDARQLEAELGEPPDKRPPAHDFDAKGKLVFRFQAPRRPFELADTPLYGADLRDIDWRRQSLIGARLEGARLGRARLAGANLRRARLQGADLRRADLTAAHLFQAGLEGASLKVARLERAHLAHARLDGASLGGAKAAGAEFRRASLRAADLASALLEGAEMTKADLTGARLDQALLAGATLAGAIFRDAHLGRTQLRGASLAGADLTGARAVEARLEATNLREADFSGAQLRGARLDGACLAGARLHGAEGLTQTQLDACFGDAAAAAVLADLGLAAPAHWAETALGKAEADAAWAAWRAARSETG